MTYLVGDLHMDAAWYLLFAATGVLIRWVGDTESA
jgi:hypothetical protein